MGDDAEAERRVDPAPANEVEACDPTLLPPSLTTSEGFRPVLPDEVLEPGYRIKLNLETGVQEVSIDPLPAATRAKP